jgi:hypothetical protein
MLHVLINHLVPTGGPPAGRFQATFLYDSADGYDLLYGGCSSGSVPCPSGLSASSFADSWSLATGSSWTLLTPPGQAPPDRADAGGDFDSADAYVLLFGGYGILSYLIDTWTFTGSAGWALL